jgi:taurine dioxygenase
MLNAKSGPRIRHLPPESAPYETLTLDKLTPVIGAEIAGIDLFPTGCAA